MLSCSERSLRALNIEGRTQRLALTSFSGCLSCFRKKKRKWVINSILEYLVESDVDTLVVVGVETLDEVDTDEDVE